VNAFAQWNNTGNNSTTGNLTVGGNLTPKILTIPGLNYNISTQIDSAGLHLKNSSNAGTYDLQYNLAANTISAIRGTHHGGNSSSLQFLTSNQANNPQVRMFINQSRCCTW
jgi:hypothetical protein